MAELAGAGTITKPSVRPAALPALPPLTSTPHGPGSHLPLLGLPTNTQQPLLLSLENLDRIVSQLAFLQGALPGAGVIAELPSALQECPSQIQMGRDLWAKFVAALGTPDLKIIPLHQLATVEERSLAQAVKSLQTEPRDAVKELLGRFDSAIDQVAVTLHDTLGANVIGLGRLGDVIRDGVAQSLADKTAQLSSVLTSLLHSAISSGATSRAILRAFYRNRFLRQRARKQAHILKRSHGTRSSNPSLPEHILQILARIVVRIFSF